MTQPTPPPHDPWPTPDAPTLVSERETVVGTPPPVGPPPVDPSPDRRIGAGLLLGLGAVALVAIGILLAYLLTHRDSGGTTTVTTSALTAPPVAAKVAVPHFVGLKEAEALVRMGQAGLKPKEVFKTQASAPGIVLSQAPQQGSEVAKGSVVTLVVAKAPAATTATGPTSTTPTPATTAPTTTAPTTSSPATTTTAATPPPQPTTATMPDVSGQKEASAVQAMNKAGILASLVFVPGSDPPGIVVQAAKSAGTTVPYHSHVQLNLSKGPNASTNAQVPNVVGQALTQALSSLNGAHLRLIFLRLPVTSTTQAGKIVQQSPVGGGQAPENAQVLVYLGAFRAP